MPKRSPGWKKQRNREKNERRAQVREAWHRKNWDEKVKAALGQSSPGKAKADAPQSLARAPIGQPSTILLPAAKQLAGLAQSFQDEGFAANDLARRQQEWQATETAAATRKLTKREKEEQWIQSMEEGSFKMLAGRQQLVDRFKVIIDRHRRCQVKRNEIVLGCAEPDPRVHLEHYDRKVAEIKRVCLEENMFQVLIENYEDYECYSMDMD